MNNNKHYSDEHLNAFIDDQLDNIEKSEILDAIRHDAELSQRVCKLQKLHNLIQLSYQSIDIPIRHNSADNKENVGIKWFAVASILLVVGTFVGWTSHELTTQNNSNQIVQLTQPSAGLSTTSERWKLMLHVSTANPTRLNLVLNEAEALLQEYDSSSRNLELEILTNSDGLALVTNDGENYNQRLQQLQNKYDNLAVMVCGQTLKRIQKIHGKKLKLLPNTNIVPSAIKQIVKRQKSGWSYIRI